MEKIKSNFGLEITKWIELINDLLTSTGNKYLLDNNSFEVDTNISEENYLALHVLIDNEKIYYLTIDPANIRFIFPILGEAFVFGYSDKNLKAFLRDFLECKIEIKAEGKRQIVRFFRTEELVREQKYYHLGKSVANTNLMYNPIID